MAGKEQGGGGPPRLPLPAASTQPPIKELFRQLDFNSPAFAGNPAMAAAATAVSRAVPVGYPQPHHPRPAVPMGIPPPQLQPRGLPLMRPHQLMHVPLPPPAVAMTMPVPVPQVRRAQPQPVPRPPVAVPLKPESPKPRGLLYDGKDGTPTKKCCNCRRSKCLKLYCECFASGVYCDGCNCMNCFNNVENEAARREVMDAILQRNPNAFGPKIWSSHHANRNNMGIKQSFSRTKEAAESKGLSTVDNSAFSSSFTIQSEVANLTMDAESPISVQFSEYEDAETGSVFNEAGAGLRIASKTIIDSAQFGEPLPEYSTGFMEPTLHSLVAARESSNVDHSSRLETFMSEAPYTNNLTQKEAGVPSAAGMPSSQGKMEDTNSIWLPASETDIPITAWIDAAMEGPVTASLGPMAPLLRQVHSLSAMAPEHIQGGSEDDVKRLQEHLEVLCRDLLEPEETSLTPKWWRKEVREVLYDTQDRLDEVIVFQAGGISELVGDVEDACERRKRLQLAPNKTTKPERGEVGLSYFNPQWTSVKVLKPISVQGNPAGLGVVGTEDPMNKLVEQLAFDDDKQKHLKVIPIVGFPGVGKTTVAGILYYEYRGKFQCSAFVRVSRTPDTRSLLISILSQIKAPGLCGFPDVHDLIDGIRKHLKDKRYFIIMDDLWTASIWDIISRAFPDADYGSRIITTTQIDDVALACCRYDSDYIEISPLNDDQSKKLFFTRVFGSEDHCPPDFIKVLCKIINKCAGLPLAIVCIASLLASESYLIVEKWEHIQDSLPCTKPNPTSEVVKSLSSGTAVGSGGRMLARGPKIEKWKCTQDSLPFTSEGLKQVLNLVYNNLPPHLKVCLLYLSMYPEGYLARKHDLVRQWVAEDFVNAMGGRDAEETAGVYFDELVSRGMVQHAATSHSNEVLSCTVHHMVLDLIRHKSKELNFVITVDNLQSTLALPDEVRRLSIQFGCSKGSDLPENILISKVRSLLFWGFFECVPSVGDYALLRVLILHIWADGDETSFDLTSISELLLLRYLKIQCNIMVNLPDEMKGLKCLETLEVDARLSAVPCDIGHLKKLLHLLFPSEAILPKGLDGLTSLLTLGCFDLSKNSTQNVIDLAKLTNLQDVHLTCSAEPSELPVGCMEHLGSILEKFNDLRSLTLHGAESSSQIIPNAGLSIVSPSPALLEKLELLPRICTLSRLPKWIGELSRLSILKIEVLNLSINDIAILKELASLASLSLYVRTEDAEWIIFDNEGFPVLKYFKFVRTAPCMSFLEGAMPNVQKLKLAFDAKRLKEEYSPGTFGFQHMTSLTQISVKFGGAGADDSNKRDAECVWKDAFTNHPNNPILVARWVNCIFNGDKTTDVEDTKGHDSRASTSSDTIEVVGQISKKARLH